MYILFVNLSIFQSVSMAERETEKAKGPKILKILQEQKLLAGVELRMCAWNLPPYTMNAKKCIPILIYNLTELDAVGLESQRCC